MTIDPRGSLRHGPQQLQVELPLKEQHGAGRHGRHGDRGRHPATAIRNPKSPTYRCEISDWATDDGPGSDCHAPIAGGEPMGLDIKRETERVVIVPTPAQPKPLAVPDPVP